ncbi:MAG: hypothetical protein K2P67_11180, partial [Gallionellaceae bacterium]|nr:hypothetical protein [Gallionellaceae bacterium]
SPCSANQAVSPAGSKSRRFCFVIVINLLRNPIHPQGVGRCVPGGFAATHPLAASRVGSD